MSVKSKHSSKKSSGGKREKKKKIEDSDDDIESSEEELDLTKECHPIGYYLNNRTEMINQMFTVIKGNKLKAMLPPILKDCDLEQLKLQCLDQLLGMSEKRITCILEGETLETSSESEVVESDECDSDGDEKNGTSGSSSDRSDDDSQDDCHANNVDGKHKKKRKGDLVNEGKAGKLQRTDSEPPEQGKTLLEILELEMRARAIRALLKQSGSEKGSDQVTEEESKTKVNGIKEVSGEVVDLTECEDEESPASPQKKREKMEEEGTVKKAYSFDKKKIEKSKLEKTNSQEDDEKSKRLQAELGLRNKLFKKKIYRTRQQRMENDEEEKNPEMSEKEEITTSGSGENGGVVIKQEPIEAIDEVILEDPEEGEISTSEDELLLPIEIKQEPVEEPKDDFESKLDEGAERVTAIDNGTFVNNTNITVNETVTVGEEEKESKVMEGENDVPKETENQEIHVQPAEESESVVEETSWRDRWLQKDGVQKLVKSSKILAKVKKRIAEKSQKAKEEVVTPYEVNSDSNSNSRLEMIEGSIEEYERLLSKNYGQKEDSSLNRNGNSQEPTSGELPSENPESGNASEKT